MSLVLPALAIAAPLLAQEGESETTPKIYMPTVPATQERQVLRLPGTDAASSNGIAYHGGPVMTGPINVYLIWYGNWRSTDSTVAILTDEVANIGGTAYFNINAGYYDAAGNRVKNYVLYQGAYYDSYSQGASPNVDNIARYAIDQGKLPYDPNGVYAVLASSDVAVSGFKTQWCGYHTTYPTSDFRLFPYLFVGDPGERSSGGGSCGVGTQSPNNNPRADAMASILAHELEETATDPRIDAWYSDSDQSENADKCAWTWGSTQTAPNGSPYNQRWGSRYYLIQQNWVNDAGGYCGQSWSPIPLNTALTLTSKNSGQVLDDPASALNEGTGVVQWPSSGYPNQNWIFSLVNGGYEVTNQASLLQFDVAGGQEATNDGASLIQWSYWGGTNEIFNLSLPDVDGYFSLSALHSGKCLDVPGGSTMPGTGIRQYTCTGTANQKWKLVKVQ
jgi:Phosphate-induced protein 1 conserved region/Ricin-type beta-trefoil lectin domain-like